MAAKKLYRSREDAMIGGVCSGLAEYFNIDSTVVRLATVILIFPGGLSFWAYIIAWIIIPQRPFLSGVRAADSDSDNRALAGEGQSGDEVPGEKVEESSDKSRYIFGIALVALGVLFLLNTHDVLFFSFGKLWPIIFIVIGIAILYKAANRGGDKDES